MIKYSIEKLFHFQCDNCKLWWSIGDHQFITKNDELLTCPHCGIKDRLEGVDQDD